MNLPFTPQQLADLEESLAHGEREWFDGMLRLPLDSSPDNEEMLGKWCPHSPWPKQQLFLNLQNLEAFYGGAAAGGKSDALLMAALQYVHVPGYAALILRKDTQRLRLAGGLIPRSHEWLAGKARWRERQNQWRFPSGATISFGYLQNSQDKYRYGSSEFQYIAFDELTEFPEDDYLFLFSRLRKTTGLAVPLRVRSASNPGNLGHVWVKRRFISEEAIAASQAAAAGLPSNHDAVFQHNAIAYVPARIADNPAVNEQEYRRSLMHLPPVARERLMHGDWTIQEQGLIRPAWLRKFSLIGDVLQFRDAGGNIIGQAAEKECRRIATIDPAGTSADRANERRGRPPSWSVIAIWDLPFGQLGRLMALRSIWRRRVGFDELCGALRQAHTKWRPHRMYIENEKLGQAAVDVLARKIPLETIATGGADKVARAAPLIHKLQQGEVFLPQAGAPWRSDFEAELFSWTGLGEETTDQIDAAAYAARLCDHNPRGPLVMEPVW